MNARLITVGFNSVLIAESIRALDFCTREWQEKELALEHGLQGIFYFNTYYNGETEVPSIIKKRECARGIILGITYGES